MGKKEKKKGNIQTKLFEELQIKLNNIKYEILSFAFLHEYEVSFRKKKEKKSRICVYLQTIRTINHPYFPKKKKIPNSYHKKLSSLVLNDILSLIHKKKKKISALTFNQLHN